MPAAEFHPPFTAPSGACRRASYASLRDPGGATGGSAQKINPTMSSLQACELESARKSRNRHHGK